MTSGIKNSVAPVVSHDTLPELLIKNAMEEPSKVVYTFLKDGENDLCRFTNKQLLDRVRIIAAKLERTPYNKQPVLLFFPSGLGFLEAFWACLYAGVIAVPVYPTRNFKAVERLWNIVLNAGAKIVLADRKIYEQMTSLLSEDDLLQNISDLEWIFTEELVQTENLDMVATKKISPDSIALLQYTSGSTGMPKGVMISHYNLMENSKLIMGQFGLSASSTIVSWLPLYHDMGLLGSIIQAVYAGSNSVLMSPVSFLQKPVRWLKAISLYRGTASTAPNFAYDFCATKIKEEALTGIDLQSWKVACNGAEPLSVTAIDKFINRFAKYGFSEKAIFPCYGMAETTLLATNKPINTSYHYLELDVSALSHGFVQAANKDTPSRRVVSSGTPVDSLDIRIVDPVKLKLCSTNEIGEIWISGSSVAGGYWNNDELSVFAFQNCLNGFTKRFLRTGDLGFFHNGELYITGRIKDVIIIRGSNYYPHDIEQTVLNVLPESSMTSCAAFSIDKNGEEKLVVVTETDSRMMSESEGEHLTGQIRKVISIEFNLFTDTIVFVRKSTLPKTSSGKIQRYLCAENYQKKELKALYPQEY